MNRRQREGDEGLRVIRLWDYAEAVKALPYIRSLTNSLRDQWLELRVRQTAAQRLAEVRRPSRHDRIALEQAQKDAREAEEEFDDTLRELMAMDIYSLDAVRGLALIPFQHGEELAWFVYDRFAENPLTSWRYHHDPLHVRRPITAVQRQIEGPRTRASVANK